MRLESSIVALAGFLRKILEHLHERFLPASLIIVQQAMMRLVVKRTTRKNTDPVAV